MTPTRREVLLAAAGLMQPAGGGLEGGRIDARRVAALMADQKLSRDALMVQLLPAARKNAHAPISNYFVGAVAFGTSGGLYLGQNIEIPGNMLGLAVHAEQSVIANAYMSDETGIEAIAVTAAPCGHCRQFLSEVSPDLKMRILLPDSPPLLLSELLPRAFGPKDLGLKTGLFPVRMANLPTLSHANDALVQRAFRAACRAYSPYSKSPSGVALSTSTGAVFTGSYLENAAFNPSLPPLETALASYYAQGSNAAGVIERAVLVEGETSSISHQATTRSVLASIAPKALFERFTF